MTVTAFGEAVASARRLVAGARRTGQDWLVEAEALEVARALGIPPPRSIAAAGPDDVDQAALDELDTPEVVVKGQAPGVIHKTERGWVRTVPAAAGPVRAAMVAMVDGPGGPPGGYLIQRRVAAPAGPAGELLLGVRFTAEFGPVVSLGPGGIYAEFMAGLAPDTTTIIAGGDGRHSIDRALADAPLAGVLTRGYRGRPPALSYEALVGLLERLAEFAVAMVPDDVAEFEMNPVVPTVAGPVALDAVLRVGSPGPRRAPARPLDKLGHLLEPRSLAVVGVSKHMNPGRLILRNVLRAGYPAERVTVVKPGVEQLDGCRCVPDLAALPGAVDLLVVSVAAEQIPGLMNEVIERRCAESVILIPGGFGERQGTEAAAVELRTAIEATRRSPDRGPLVNGSNCLGVRSGPGRYDTFFIPAHKLAPPSGRERPVALISQSGALILSALDRLAWLQPRYAVSVGNQVDLTVGDYLEHFAAAPDVAVAACYVEGFRPGDGSRFLTAARRMRERGGAVVLYRAGRTPSGAGAAASHTAAIAGDYEVTRSLAEAAGVLVAPTLADFTDLLTLATLLGGRRVDGAALGAVSNAGFEAVAMADGLGPLSLAELEAATVASLDAVVDDAGLAALVAVRNPLDVTPAAGDAAFAAAAQVMLDAAEVDVGLVGCVPFTAALETLGAGGNHGEDVTAERSVARRLMRLATDKAWAAVLDAGAVYDPMARLLVEAGIPVFRQGDRAVRLFGRYCAWRRGATTGVTSPGRR